MRYLKKFFLQLLQNILKRWRLKQRVKWLPNYDSSYEYKLERGSNSGLLPSSSIRLITKVTYIIAEVSWQKYKNFLALKSCSIIKQGLQSSILC